MARIFLIYLVFFALFFVGIPTIRKLTNQEKWELIKLLTYSAVCAILAFSVLAVIVILF
jgi:hypothetical protein